MDGSLKESRLSKVAFWILFPFMPIGIMMVVPFLPKLRSKKVDDITTFELIKVGLMGLGVVGGSLFGVWLFSWTMQNG